jgi:hypothetical protein
MVWSNNYLTINDSYTICGSGMNLYSIDHTDLSQSDLLWTVDTPGMAMDFLQTEELLYIACGSGGVQIYQYQETELPVLITSIANINAYDLAISDTLLFVADFGYGLRIYSVSDIDNPFQIGSYNGSGGLWRIALSDTCILGLRSSSGIKIISVSDPYSPYLAGSYALSGVQNISLRDTLAYVSSSGNGINIFDISELDQPVWLDNYDFQGMAGGLSYSGNALYVSNGFGISVLDSSNPYNIQQSDFLDPEHIGFAMENAPVIRDDLLLLWNNYNDRLYVYSLLDALHPVLVETYYWNKRVRDAIWNDDTLLTANESLGFCLLDFPLPIVDIDEEIVSPSAHLVYPNPTCTGANIRLAINAGILCNVSIYNIKGQLVWQSTTTDKTEVYWDGKDRKGKALPAGIYLIRSTSKGYSTLSKLLKL